MKRISSNVGEFSKRLLRWTRYIRGREVDLLLRFKDEELNNKWWEYESKLFSKQRGIIFILINILWIVFVVNDLGNSNKIIAVTIRAVTAIVSISLTIWYYLPKYYHYTRTRSTIIAFIFANIITYPLFAISFIGAVGRSNIVNASIVIYCTTSVICLALKIPMYWAIRYQIAFFIVYSLVYGVSVQFIPIVTVTVLFQTHLYSMFGACLGALIGLYLLERDIKSTFILSNDDNVYSKLNSLEYKKRRLLLTFKDKDVESDYQYFSWRNRKEAAIFQYILYIIIWLLSSLNDYLNIQDKDILWKLWITNWSVGAINIFSFSLLLWRYYYRIKNWHLSFVYGIYAAASILMNIFYPTGSTHRFMLQRVFLWMGMNTNVDIIFVAVIVLICTVVEAYFFFTTTVALTLALIMTTTLVMSYYNNLYLRLKFELLQITSRIPTLSESKFKYLMEELKIEEQKGKVEIKVQTQNFIVESISHVDST